MIVKHMIPILILFSLLCSFNSQLLLLKTFTFVKDLRNKKYLQSFLKCVLKKKGLGSDIFQMIQSIMFTSKSSKTNITQIQERLNDDYENFLNCIENNIIPKFPDGTSVININKIYGMKYDWMQYLSCLTGKAKNLTESPVNDFINLIVIKDYYTALRKEFKLRNNGNDIVKECMPTRIKSLYTKQNNSTNSTNSTIDKQPIIKYNNTI